MVKLCERKIDDVDFEVYISSYPLKVCKLEVDGIPIYFNDSHLATVIRTVQNCIESDEFVEMLSRDIDDYEFLRFVNRAINYIMGWL